MNQRNGPNGGEPPVNVGDEINVKIESVADKGDGVAKRSGFVIFVPGTQVGDEVKIRITKVLKNLAFSEKIGPADGPIETAPERPRKHFRGEVNLPPPMKAPEPVEDSEDFGEDIDYDEEVYFRQ